MTKLHDEIENAIKKLIKDYSTYFTINPSQLRDYIVEYLGKYLTIPLELVDEIWGMKVYKSDNTHHTQLTDQKLIDKIMSIIRENLWQDYNIDLWDCIKSELGVYLTQPTDEGIEKEEPTEKLLAATAPINGDMWCEIYGYIKDGIVNVTRTKYIHPDDEVKPPTKDTIEKIWDFKDLYSFPNNPRVGQTCAGYIWNGEHRLEQGFDYMKFECLRTKYNELVDTVNHQQEQIQQLLSGK